MGILLDVIQLLGRPALVFRDHCTGMSVSLKSFFLPADPEVGFSISPLAGDRIGKGGFRVKIPDVTVARIAAAPDSKSLGAVDNALGGLQAEGILLVLLGSAAENGQEGFAVEVPGSCASGLEEGWDEVHVLNQCVRGGARFHFLRPSGDHSGGQAQFEAGPFRKGKSGALLGHHYDERVVSEAEVIEE